jgi:aspartate ammonia-lyase
MNYRLERDPLGDVRVPADAYYGAQTARAVENFPISGLRMHDELITATVVVKKAAAEANVALDRLPREIGRAIVQAADEILAGRLRDQFVVDVYQAGAGTSHNMNANEVLANRAAELLGAARGDSTRVHPNDHVNMAQSTNDVFPTATRLALLMTTPALVAATRHLAQAFERKAREFDAVLKTGRTHLQDAVPMTLGQEFGGYAANLAVAAVEVERASGALEELNLGATAVGTGLNAGADYTERAIERLRAYTGLPLRAAENRFRVTQSMGDVLAWSGAVRRLAVELSKIASDLRLLSSGPRAGFAEIILPAVQPGSSIMPGKVNPSVPEMVNQVCYQVRGCDATIEAATEAGQLELNVMMPVIAWNALHSAKILANAIDVLRARTVEGIQADAARGRELLDRSTAVATALSPYIGYAATAEIAKASVATGRPIRDLVLERGLLPAGELDRILSAEAMTTPGIAGAKSGAGGRGPEAGDQRPETYAQTRTSERGPARGPAAERGDDRAARAARAPVSAAGSRPPRGPGSRRVAEARADHGRAGHRRRRGGR